ncbi:pentapeptide repeat-containing protein [Anabaena sp. UHCC 0187]|uniref:pentapeptide repeat-containing protein n=1 Tax=Anabaena sp. UHCC 0187 TaxID=2590018 RepID=UPI00144639E4|nr:pentapeptide repeat-containing protein [Anabaena sp. UHCC 0187]MDP5017526.1 pentapeptide repeat-containing protein [Dolichospermum sp.]MTJ11252.1 pentapeptide repeat-containing protein [Anabaena sp. UHCC 0187]
MLKVFFIARHFLNKINTHINSILENKISPKIIEIQQKSKHTQQYQDPKNYLAKVIEQLEQYPMNTNIDTIHDLEHIADINPQYHWVIMNMLTNLVRNNTVPATKQKITNNSADKISPFIQAAITVIARRDTTKDPEDEQIDLSYTDLRGINLQGANLKQINLYQANLSGVNLANANLEGAILTAANLEGANLNLANLSGAILSAANLDKANLAGANLQRANLYLASLQGAILNDTLLESANLREAKFTV